jgi:hypothetical protein
MLSPKLKSLSQTFPFPISRSQCELLWVSLSFDWFVYCTRTRCGFLCVFFLPLAMAVIKIGWSVGLG